ncbi:MAG: CPBP family intramembrane metalloprotease [Clostridia bacterium]|nr:CPBP family intramembrane metalloprotease [Clostridia bacterium]
MEKNTFVVKRNIYNHDDSGKVFILAIFLPFILSFFASLISEAIADGQGIDITDVTSSIWFHLCFTILNLLTYVGIWLSYSKLKDIRPVVAAKMKIKQKWQNYIIPVVLGIVMLFGFQYLVQAFDNLLEVVGYPVDRGFGSVDPENAGEYIYAIFALAVVPAFIEELLFRGVIFNGLRERFPTGWAAVISAAMFAIAHGNLQQLIYPLIFGTFLALVVARTGSLISSMLVHFVNNLLVVSFRFIENTTGFSLNLPNVWWFYLIAVAAAGVAFLVCILVDKFCFKHKNHEEVEKSSLKTSNFLYISLAIGLVMYIINVVSYILQ